MPRWDKEVLKTSTEKLQQYLDINYPSKTFTFNFDLAKNKLKWIESSNLGQAAFDELIIRLKIKFREWF